MKVAEIKTDRAYENLMNGKTVTVTEMHLATVEFTGCEVPMLKTLFAKNFRPV